MCWLLSKESRRAGAVVVRFSSFRAESTVALLLLYQKVASDTRWLFPVAKLWVAVVRRPVAESRR